MGKIYRAGPSTGGTVAKDPIGNDVIAEKWLETHGPGDRTLTQGLKVNEQHFSVQMFPKIFNKMHITCACIIKNKRFFRLCWWLMWPE